MNYREWITAMGARFNISASDVELILVNQSKLIPDATATVETTIAKRALCNELSAVLPMMNISEGGYSISWNIESAKWWYTQTCKELGIASVLTPTLRDRSNIW